MFATLANKITRKCLQKIRSNIYIYIANVMAIISNPLTRL